MKHQILVRLIVLLSLSALQACGGGGGGTGNSSNSGSSTTGTVQVKLNIPISTASVATNLIQPQSYVSAKTRSVNVSVTSVNGVPPSSRISTLVPVMSGTDCSVDSGTLSCTITLDVPVGSVALNVSTYPQTSVGGSPISSGNTTIDVTGGAIVNADVTLLGVVASIDVNYTPTILPIAGAGTFTATITGKDVNGDVITGTDPYYTPITVWVTVPDSNVTASLDLPAQLTSPAQNTITFNYDGLGTAETYELAVGTGALTKSVYFPFSATAQHLYVASQADNAVYVYDIQADGSITGPVRTLAGSTTTLAKPTSIAVDDTGTLYVVNYGRDVTVYAPGAIGDAAPVETLLSGQNPVYVSDKAGAFVTATNQIIPTTQFTYTLPSSGGLETLPPYSVPNSVAWAFYQADAITEPAFCTGTYSSLSSVGFIQCGSPPVLQTNGVVSFASNFGFNPGAIADMKFQPNGYLTVSTHQTSAYPAAIDTYSLPFGAQGTVSPILIAEISGPNTLLSLPYTIAFDAHGNFYVSDPGVASNNGSVHVYTASAFGNTAPVQNLTGLNYPFGIAIGP
jgi:hypothetical protein